MDFFVKEQSPRKEKGVVLVAALIAIALVSVLVASSLGTSSVEEKMAFNAQSANQAFQAAQTAIDVVGQSESLMLEAIDNGIGGTSAESSTSLGITRLKSKATLEYRGEAVVYGYSLPNKAYKFEADGQGFIDDNGVYGDSDDEAKTRIRQGMYRITYIAE